MKKRLLFFVLIGISLSAFAQIQVSGNQSGLWTESNSPYQVIGEIIVPSGQVLTIEPGVEINFQGHYKFTVQGELQAIGTASQMINFTTFNQAIGWGGIRFDHSTGISSLSYCRIEFGKTMGEYPDHNGGGMALINSNAVVSNCIFADNDATGNDNGMGGAVYAINTGGMSETLTSFTDCQFLRNHAYGEGGAIKFTSDFNTEIRGCEFIGNNCFYGGGAISFYAVVDTKVIYSLFADNFTSYSNGGAINTVGFGNTVFFKNCTISGNSAPGGEGGGVSLAYATADFVNSIIVNNPGLYGDDIVLSVNGAAEVNYCDLTMPSGATGSNNMDVDPLFVDSEALDFNLTENSPCIDAGTDIGIPYNGTAPDMGSYEYGLLNTSNFQRSDFIVYPNPSKGILNIEASTPFQTIIITDILGKIVYSLNTDRNQLQIDISNLNKGVYFMTLQMNSKDTITKKIILD